MPVIRVITAISYDPTGQYVQRVRWGLADTDTNRWKTRPAESHIIHVLEALKYGEDVWTVLTEGEKVSAGPRVHAVKIRPGPSRASRPWRLTRRTHRVRLRDSDSHHSSDGRLSMCQRSQQCLELRYIDGS